VGEGEHRLTFPACFIVGDALASPHWVRVAQPGETNEKGEHKWWAHLEFQPQAIIHSTGALAMPDEPIGMFGDTVTVLEQAPADPSVTELPRASLDEIHTPPTPGSSVD